MNLRQAAQQALEALEKVKTDADKQPPVYPWDIWRMWVDRAITNLRAALAEPQTTHWEGCEAVHPECRKPEQEPLQESTPIYLAEVTMPDPLIGGYILDDDLWCNGAAWCLECRHEWVAVWPLGAESLECPACGSTDTDREQAGPHKRKGEQHE